MSDRERRVRDEAYRLWDEDGRPSGRDEAYWYEAEKRVGASEVPSSASAKKAKAVKPVVKGEGISGVPSRVANDEAKPREKKGAAVEVGLVSKPKKAAPPETIANGKPAKDKSGKGGRAQDKAAKPQKPKSKARERLRP